MSKKPKTTRAVEPFLRISDPNGAPIIYFEGAPNSGCSNGIVNITLAAARNLPDGDRIHKDVVAVAFLRCSVTAAKALRHALDNALLLEASSGASEPN